MIILGLIGVDSACPSSNGSLVDLQLSVVKEMVGGSPMNGGQRIGDAMNSSLDWLMVVDSEIVAVIGESTARSIVGSSVCSIVKSGNMLQDSGSS